MDDLVPDRPLACEPTGDDGRTVRVCVVLPPDGNPVVLHDRCPHRDIRLSGGVVRDGELVCPGHFWRFDVRTGHRTDAVSGGVPLHESRIVDGWVQALLPTPEAPLSMRAWLLQEARRFAPADANDHG